MITKIQNQPAVPKDSVSRMKPSTSGDIELNLNGQTIWSVGSTMLLNMRLRQQGLRPVDVGGEGDFFPEQFRISYMVIPIITYSLDKLVFNTLAITVNI